ncbi:hypothetical protein [Ralstonia mannitolilytica]|uniref:hypothetical protein n=1 Tax=Ralstonia TaxID=48736 RepID=UPI000CEF3C1B|nr:hypothetical protein [Ralstonia mannitolilytica]CAJ0743486.1 hypothetical protein R76696_04515 [Ralstonia mannitolilytica]
MRKFNIPARRFSAIVRPFSSPFVQARAGAPERTGTASATANRRTGDGGQALPNHGYAAAAIRLSRTYW